MPDYSKGQIYSIRFYDNDNLLYIGSTIQPLAVRFGCHKRNIECSLFQYIQEYYNGDFKCCYIELLEYCECNNKQELNKREGEILRQYKADNNNHIINKNIAGRDIKQYYQDNADKLLEYQKQYKENNTDKILEYQKQYRENNADKKKEYSKKYYQENAEKIKEKQKQNRKNK